MSSNVSRNATIKRRSELKNAFHSAKSAEEMLKAFQKSEGSFDENQLGMECWRLAHQFYTEGTSPEKILCFGKRALQTLIHCENHCTVDMSNSIQPWSFSIASVLYLLGYACGELKRYDESFSYLNWSDRNLS